MNIDWHPHPTPKIYVPCVEAGERPTDMGPVSLPRVCLISWFGCWCKLLAQPTPGDLPPLRRSVRAQVGQRSAADLAGIPRRRSTLDCDWRNCLHTAFLQIVDWDWMDWDWQLPTKPNGVYK